MFDYSELRIQACIISRIKCRILGTRPTYSPVEHVGQIIFLHFSNSLVNMFAKLLVNMLAKSLENIMAKSLVSLLAQSPVSMLAKSLLNLLPELLVNILVNIHVVWVTGEQAALVTGEEVGLVFAFFPVLNCKKFWKFASKKARTKTNPCKNWF